MAIEIDIRIIGESTHDIVGELTRFASYLSGGSGVAPPQANTADPTPPEPTTAVSNGADKPATSRKRSTAPKADEPEAKQPPTAPATEKAKVDRQAIIDGLTKIYSKGDEDTRLAIQKFRDGQGADRLRDLKDDALPAAADLLTELKLAEQPAV